MDRVREDALCRRQKEIITDILKKRAEESSTGANSRVKKTRPPGRTSNGKENMGLVKGPIGLFASVRPSAGMSAPTGVRIANNLRAANNLREGADAVDGDGKIMLPESAKPVSSTTEAPVSVISTATVIRNILVKITNDLLSETKARYSDHNDPFNKQEEVNDEELVYWEKEDHEFEKRCEQYMEEEKLRRNTTAEKCLSRTVIVSWIAAGAEVADVAAVFEELSLTSIKLL
ncbi:hypothetical protein EJ04DRAFT_515279, partial [Polyplosphaeria fusca]